MLLGMPTLDRAESFANCSVVCEEFLLSEYCTTLTCFYALRWMVQLILLCYTNSVNHITALERLSIDDLAHVLLKDKVKGEKHMGVIVG